MELEIGNWRLKIYCLRDRERVIKCTEGITGDVKATLGHERTYLIRETRTEHENSILISYLPFRRLNIYDCLKFHLLKMHYFSRTDLRDDKGRKKQDKQRDSDSSYIEQDDPSPRKRDRY